MSKECNDRHCPKHSNFNTHGRSFEGKIIKMDTHGTVTIEIPRLFFINKYERYEKRRSRIRAHKPACIDVKVGDVVNIVECRPISKTKNFVIVEMKK